MIEEEVSHLVTTAWSFGREEINRDVEEIRAMAKHQSPTTKKLLEEYADAVERGVWEEKLGELSGNSWFDSKRHH